MTCYSTSCPSEPTGTGAYQARLTAFDPELFRLESRRDCLVPLGAGLTVQRSKLGTFDSPSQILLPMSAYLI